MQNAAHAPNPKPRLILVDGSGYIFRAYHALPPLTRPDGVAVGAVYGFTTMLLKLREQMPADYFAVIFDAARKTFRQEFYAQYKAHRPDPPEDLIPQFALVREATAALNLPAIDAPNYEADDLIAAYAKEATARGIEVVIVSSDKDLMQLIHDGVSMFDPMKQKEIAAAQVIEKFGVPPEKVIEVQALIGDSVDNVPGVPGIGPKTAAELIVQFGDLETLLASLDQIKQPKRREVLMQHAEAARMSHRLVTLRDDIPLPQPLEALVSQSLDTEKLLPFLQTQNFKSLVKKFGGEISPTQEDPSSRRRPGSMHSPLAEDGTWSPASAGMTAITRNYATIREAQTLRQWVARGIEKGLIAIDTETTSLDAMRAELVGVSLALAAGEACYIPLGHVTAMATDQSNLFDDAKPKRVEGQLTIEEALEILKPLLTHPGVLKIGHNLKYDLLVLRKYGVDITPIADTMLLSYCTSAGLHGHGMDELSRLHFGHETISFKSLTGSGKAQITFAQVPIDKATEYAGEDADITFRLHEKLAPEIHTQRVVRVYEECERALVPVLVEMEARGITVSRETLAGLSREFSRDAAVLEAEIHALAGQKFLLSSPKQLGEVLYDAMGIAGGKKSAKSGAYTTDAETLEALAVEGHEIARKVLDWRHLTKLQSTYTDALQAQINPKTGRVHTSFAMAIAATGRLSSTDPNLQNIPIRTEAGKRIRTAFVPAAGCKLISADYSQIELRLLADMAGIDTLKTAFHEGRDIHAITASQMFGVPVESVSGDLRRKAKTINFGIIYGISAHGLSVRLGISRPEAASYIEAYFKQYPGIKEYMERTIATARAQGFVTTLFGRRIYLKDITAKQPALRQFSERAAINAPLQGTAADIIKRAMVDVAAMLRAEFPDTHMLLQVHDELVLEAPVASAAQVAERVKTVMRRAGDGLSVPLTVEAGVGDNWGEIH
jgi:DNA polymerase-1